MSSDSGSKNPEIRKRTKKSDIEYTLKKKSGDGSDIE